MGQFNVSEHYPDLDALTVNYSVDFRNVFQKLIQLYHSHKWAPHVINSIKLF